MDGQIIECGSAQHGQVKGGADDCGTSQGDETILTESSKSSKKMPQKNNPNSIKAEKIDFQAKLNAYNKIKIKEYQKRKREKMILETKSR